MKLENFFFPVNTRKPVVPNGTHEIIDINNSDTYLETDTKSIVRVDTNKYISTVGQDYKVVTNEELITKSMSYIDELGYKWHIDNEHSFCNNKRMKLAVVFPEIQFNDGRSDVDFSMYLHNSYNRAEGIRLFMGFIREICTNGMIAGKLLGKYYHRHTSGANIENIGETVKESIANIPQIQERIEQLKQTKVTVNKELQEDLCEEFSDKLGKETCKSLYNHIYPEQETNMYILMNVITWYISHHIALQQRTTQQLKASKYFGF
jgi:hypothetical protein